MSASMPNPDANRRRSARRPTPIRAHLREPGNKPAVVIMTDLSREGFQIEHHRRFPAGSSVWLRMPGMESLAARAMWSDGWRLGCQFDLPLHHAVLEKLAAQGLIG